VVIGLYEINKEANSVLIKQLGLAKTMRFLNQFYTGKEDYTKMKLICFKV
jgi:hypothetical protein